MTHVPTYRLYGEATGEEPEFWLHCETIRSRSSLYRWEISPHRHEHFFQILYIEAGSGTALFDRMEQPIHAPSIITVPPRHSHGFRFSEDVEGLVISILGSHLGPPSSHRSRLGDWLASPHLTTLDPLHPDAAYVMQTVNRLGDEFAHRRSGRDALMAAYSALMLRLIARLSQEKAASPASDDANERRLDRLLGLLHQHFRTHRPVSFYARELGVSLTHLNRIVRAMTGHTMSDLIAAKIIEEAKRDLVFSLSPVQEISYRLGFSDPTYFSRFFVKQTGQTPLVWRRTEKQRLIQA